MESGSRWCYTAASKVSLLLFYGYCTYPCYSILVHVHRIDIRGLQGILYPSHKGGGGVHPLKLFANPNTVPTEGVKNSYTYPDRVCYSQVHGATAVA